MIRSFTKNHKVLTACTATVAAGSLLLLKQENRLKMSDAMERVSRTTYFLGNAAYIVFDYWNSFRNVERDTPEYKALEHEINERTAKRVFQICDHLGGYFAKFGQMLSSMERSIPPEFIKELSKCQDNLSAVPFSEFERVIREDLGKKPEDIFEAVDDVPIGCASLAQVHRGTLKTGEDVAIKVQYPTVARNTQVDLRNMELVTKLCSKIFKHFQYDWIVPKLRSTVESEFDFTEELQNMEQCREFFLPTPSIYVPKGYREYSSKRIVVMEYIDGIKVNDLNGIRQYGFNPHDIGMLCIQAFSDMIFRFNSVHMDPHPGNLLVRYIPGTTSPQLVILDHGMYYHFSDGFNERFRKMWLAMIQQDNEAMRESCKPWGLEDDAEILSIVFTGRGGMMNRKMGEELTEEEKEQMRKFREEQMKNPNKEKIQERMEKMQNMMKKMPLEMNAVIRNQMLLSNLIKVLDCSQYEKLSVMTQMAIRGMYRDIDGHVDYIALLKWKFYLMLLRWKLLFHDWMVDWYYRWYLKRATLTLPNSIVS